MIGTAISDRLNGLSLRGKGRNNLLGSVVVAVFRRPGVRSRDYVSMAVTISARKSTYTLSNRSMAFSKLRCLRAMRTGIRLLPSRAAYLVKVAWEASRVSCVTSLLVGTARAVAARPLTTRRFNFMMDELGVRSNETLAEKVLLRNFPATVHGGMTVFVDLHHSHPLPFFSFDMGPVPSVAKEPPILWAVHAMMVAR